LADWLMKDDKNQRENMLVVEDICQRLQDDVVRWTSCRRRWCGCVKYSICAAASGLNSTGLTIPAACISCSPPPRSPDYRVGRRWLYSRHEPFANGTPVPLAICRWRKANFAWPAFGESRKCHARLYAAGIVSGSDPEQEWQEIENKAAGLRSLLLTKA
jgi:menaquinone-specific isochorismate synthase